MDIPDVRAGRSVVAPGDQRIERIVRAFGVDFNSAIVGIAHPPAHTQHPCALAAGVSKPDAMNDTGDSDVTGRVHGK